MSRESPRAGPHDGLPALGGGVATRPRVTAHLAACLDRFGLIHVHGPPGAGKTTAVAQFVETLPDPVAWLTLSEWHRAPGRLLDALISSLEATLPGVHVGVPGVRTGQPELLLAASDLAAALSRTAGVVLVLDDCHHLAGASDALALIGALVGGRESVRTVLVGREPIPLPGAGVDAHHPDAYVGTDVLNADLAEVTAILAARGGRADPESALAATGGWVAGLVFESWRDQPGRAVGPGELAAYFSAEFRPWVGESLFAMLVETSVFETVTEKRLALLGYADPPETLSALRRLNLPATWSGDGASMRVHPRLRELLRAELERLPVEQIQVLKVAAARVLEREGQVERAVELFVASGAVDEARRLLPRVIVGIVERGDVDVAERLLAACEPALHPDADPAIHLAAHMLLSARQSTRGEIQGVCAGVRWDDPEWLRGLVEAEPRVAPFGCVSLVALGRLEDARRLLELTPPGRARDTTRLILSVVANDDPDAAPPPLLGDGLDPLIARGLWFRGRALELRQGMDVRLAGMAGIPGFVRAPGTERIAVGGLGAVLTEFNQAVERRDLDQALRTIEALAARRAPDASSPSLFEVMCEAEAAVRIARDPAWVARAVARFRELPVDSAFHREVMQVWEAGGLLLAGEDEAAVRVLRDAVARMRRGDRLLQLATALVYLAEAEWRVGNEAAADEASDEAHRVAGDQGTLHLFMLALGDFPAVASRRIDAEPMADSEWHAVGRALTVGAASVSRGQTLTGAVRLREFGEPSLVHHGVAVRPRIRKSLELLSFLVSRPGSAATRGEVLTALWNGRDDDSSRAYVRQALRQLRDALPEGVTVESRSDTLFVEGPVSSESGEVELLLSEAATHSGERRRGLLLELHEILARGAFLAGSDDVVWVDDRRERLRGTLVDVRLDLADLALQSEHYVEALRFTDEALDSDPLRERGWRIRMRTLGMLGDGDGLLGAYRACREALGMVGLEPSRATVELARTLRG